MSINAHNLASFPLLVDQQVTRKQVPSSEAVAERQIHLSSKLPHLICPMYSFSCSIERIVCMEHGEIPHTALYMYKP